MSPKLCLVVDDESSVRTFIRAILEDEQFQTYEAENGVEALRLVEGLSDGLDLIVCDIQMPGGDGLTFVSAVRESLPALPIILMSGTSTPERQAYPSTAFEFIQKPFLPETLLAAIESATRKMSFRRMPIRGE
jgi:CheY-like chemotaxis protein